MKFAKLVLVSLVVLGGVAEAATHKVEIVGMKFVPAELHVKQGDTVLFDNTSGGRHTVTNDAEQFPQAAADMVLPAGETPYHLFLDSGDTGEVEFLVEGTHQYVCLPHRKMGMIGRIIVEPQ